MIPNTGKTSSPRAAALRDKREANPEHDADELYSASRGDAGAEDHPDGERKAHGTGVKRREALEQHEHQHRERQHQVPCAR